MKRLTTTIIGAAALLAAACEVDSLNVENFLNNMNGHTDGDVDGDNDIDADADADADADTDGELNGVDLLLVVDNSASMAEEQNTLATSVYNLVNALVTRAQDSALSAVESVRVAVVSSDMGLQYGEDGRTDGVPSIATCEAVVGDDGVFLNEIPESVAVLSNVIACDPGGEQCPSSGWTCVDGFCVAPGGVDAAPVACAPLSAGPWVDNAAVSSNADFVNNVSCLSDVGTDGCGIEQPLSAGIKALIRQTQRGFVQNDHVLAVVVVSDEEDCSIEDPGLFTTPEWQDQISINTACNYPAANNSDFLFDTDYFYDRLVDVKGGREDAVVFAAVVGVPNDNSSCQGNGDQIGECLDNPDMELIPQAFTDPVVGVQYTHFRPACTRQNDANVDVTIARPGRRFVETAEQFGAQGYVYSICNEDWTPAMDNIVQMITDRINAL